MSDNYPQSSAASAEPAPATPTIGHIMSRRVVTVSMDDTLARAETLLHQFGFHHLLVVDQQRLVGVISDRDVLKASSPFTGTLNETARDLAIPNKRIHQVMSRTLITVHGGMSLDQAAQLLIDKRISCLPVVGEDGKIEGIVTWRDLLKAYFAFRSVRT